MKKILKIKGMHCNSCERIIEESLKDKVNEIKVDFKKESALIDFNEENITEDEIKKIINELGYEVEEETVKKNPEKIETKNKSSYIGWGVLIISLIALLYALYTVAGNFNIQVPSIGEKTSLILLFFVGILTGFHCISMCGGFVISYTTKNALKGEKGFKQHLIYGSSKVFSYAIIGGIFGLIGGVIAFNTNIRGMVAILAGVFMIFYALSMFGFKFFRRFQFNPKFLTKLASKKYNGPYKGPFFTGLLSGLFIACGPLQAMYLYAAGTGSFITGLTSLAAFGLGTLPVMLGFGSIATIISHKTTKKILKISAIIVLILGFVMLNRGLTVMGSPVNYDSIKENIFGVESNNAQIENGYQVIEMTVDRYGWKPNSFVLKKDTPVKWNINAEELTSCNNEIIVKEYGLDIKLQKGLNVVEFTPDKEGTVRWSCWMGMIPGSFIITESGTANQNEIKAGVPKSAGGCGCGGGSTCGIR